MGLSQNKALHPGILKAIFPISSRPSGLFQLHHSGLQHAPSLSWTTKNLKKLSFEEISEPLSQLCIFCPPNLWDHILKLAIFNHNQGRISQNFSLVPLLLATIIKEKPEQGSLSLQSFHKERRKEGRKEAPPNKFSRLGHKLPFSDNDSWLIPLISGGGSFRSFSFHLFFKHLAYIKKKYNNTEKKKNVKITAIAFQQDESTSLIMFYLIL